MALSVRASPAVKTVTQRGLAVVSERIKPFSTRLESLSMKPANFVRMIAEWREWIEGGEAMSYRAIAKKAGVASGYVQTILPLAFLAPGLTRELLDGRRQVRGGLMAWLRRGIPADWGQQLDRL